MTSEPSITIPAWPAKRLIILSQDKGGIGKSFVATLLHDFFVEREVRVRAFDLDHANSTFKRYVKEAVFIDTDLDADKLGILDQMVHALDEVDVVLADNRAAGGTKVRQYLEESRLTALQEELDVAIVLVVVAVDDKDAISQIADLVDVYEGKVRWLVVRNLRDGAQPSVFMDSRTRQRLASLGAVEIEVACLAEVTRNRLQLSNLTVGRGRTAPELHLLDRSRCVRFHEKMASEFTRAGKLLIP